ncbi:hypothetical protein HanIR_Chr07g0323841 [Helianthus annuus]|nr:hypothetical protein HanIR_Chr07g0323841 [Helianthus annuus]
MVVRSDSQLFGWQSVRTAIRSDSSPVGWLFEWIVSSFEKDVFVYDGLTFEVFVVVF